MRGFWGDFTDGMRAKAKTLGKQNFFIFGEAFDGNDDLIGSVHDGRQGRAGHVRPVRLGVLLLAEVPRHRQRCSRNDPPTKNLECLYNSRIGRKPTRRVVRDATAIPPGPTSARTPHAQSADGGIGLAPQPGARQLPRQPRSAALHVREDRPRTCCSAALDVPVHVGRHPVRLLRHRAGLRRRRRSEEPRGHVRAATRRSATRRSRPITTSTSSSRA